MQVQKVAIVLILFFAAGCRCTTYFSDNESMSVESLDYSIRSTIQEESTENDILIIEFDFCSNYASLIKCPNKNLVEKTLSVEASLLNKKLNLENRYASEFYFSADKFDQIWKESSELTVTINYTVDSAGVLLNKNAYHVLKKDTKCRTRFAMH